MKTLPWFTVQEMSEPQKTVFDGRCAPAVAYGIARAANEMTGNRVVLLRGLTVGRFVLDFPQFDI